MNAYKIKPVCFDETVQETNKMMKQFIALSISNLILTTMILITLIRKR